MKSNDLLLKVYDATRAGLDIITELLPAVDDAVINKKKAFRLRPDERTPSAHLYPPKDSGDCWHVVDYGGGEGERSFSPIDLYMWLRGEKQFSVALHELAEAYGVEEELKSSVNKPEITQREALPSEVGLPPRVTTRDTFTDSELAAWGPLVKAEHLIELGWKAVDSIATTKEGKTTIKKSTPTYPIFVQECGYTDSDGIERTFMKLYEPKNFNKAFRFFIVGKKPPRYLFGLEAVRRKFNERGEEKLEEVVLVSGGSDAVNCLSMGYQPVWLGSETDELREDNVKLLLKYARRIVNIPDIDATGKKMGCQLALRYQQIWTVWMTPEDMGHLHDNRGRQRKDLKDFIQLHPHRADMERLMARAQCAHYWMELVDKDGNVKYTISPARLNYYLSLHGYFTMKDDNRKEPLYIHIDGIKVCRVTAKTIGNFLIAQACREGLSEGLISHLMRSRDLPTNQVSHLIERDDLDFTKCTPASQLLFFSNCWVEVTSDSITQHGYSELCNCYVWDDSVIDHNYRKMPPMFSVEHAPEGYRVTIVPNVPSKFFRYVINASRLYWRKQDEGGMQLTIDEEHEEHQCLASKLAAIGYLLHGYKSESEAWALLCQDSKLAENENECNGGSGKSFFLKAVSKLLNMYYIDAHVQNITENRFIFDGVTPATDLVLVDECHLKLNYDFFFGRITGELKGEEKGNHPFAIPFKESPKFAFATNYVLKKHDASTERRIWPQVFSDYYHEKTALNDYLETRTIRDDLGCNLLGTEYSDQDWQADIAFMLQCLQFYLSLPVGERRIMPPMNRIEQREQMAAIGKDFRQWADDYFAPDGGNLDRDLKAEEILNAFNAETRYNWSPKKLAQHLKDYCIMASHIHCLNPASVTGKDKDGERWQKNDGSSKKTFYYVMSEQQYLTESTTQQAQEQDLPF